jgi:uncharacterized glyoxalase superfamily protein PhnB
MHVELEAPSGGGLYLGQPPNGFQNPSRSEATSQTYVIVDDVDAHHERAVAVGATVVEQLTDTPFGHRRYGCCDPQGHRWYFAEIRGDGRLPGAGAGQSPASTEPRR